MKTIQTLLLAGGALLLSSCGKGTVDPPGPGTNPTPALSYENITFNREKAYFSTSGATPQPVVQSEAELIVNKIDITFFYNYDYTAPGFMEPVTRSKEYYWDEYMQPFLAAGVETQFYGTMVTKAMFDEARNDQAKIAAHFSDTNSTKLAPHGVFPNGSTIGGRTTSGPNSLPLSMGKVYGFKNVVSGKRGFIYIRTDQKQGWPRPITSFDTKVDIIREK